MLTSVCTGSANVLPDPPVIFLESCVVSIISFTSGPQQGISQSSLALNNTGGLALSPVTKSFRRISNLQRHSREFQLQMSQVSVTAKVTLEWKERSLCHQPFVTDAQSTLSMNNVSMTDIWSRSIDWAPADRLCTFELVNQLKKGVPLFFS